MRTIKIKETTLFTLKNTQAQIGINTGIKLKTYDDVIIFLYQASLELNLTDREKEFLEKSRKYFNDKQRQK